MFCVDSVVISTKFVSFMKKVTYTGKSFSEALILAPVNPQCDESLLIEFQEKYKFTTCCFECQNKNKENNFCTQHVVNLYFSWRRMNNLSSYFGLIQELELLTQIYLYMTKFVLYF